MTELEQVMLAKNAEDAKKPTAPGALPSQSTLPGLPSPLHYGIELRSLKSGKTKVFPVETSDIVVDFSPVTYGFHLAPIGTQVAFATRSKVRVYDLKTGEKLLQISPESDRNERCITSFAITADKIAVGNLDGEVRLFSMKDGTFQNQIRNREEDHVHAMKFSPDGSWLAYRVASALHFVKVD